MATREYPAECAVCEIDLCDAECDVCQQCGTEWTLCMEHERTAKRGCPKCYREPVLRVSSAAVGLIHDFWKSPVLYGAAVDWIRLTDDLYAWEWGKDNVKEMFLLPHEPHDTWNSLPTSGCATMALEYLHEKVETALYAAITVTVDPETLALLKRLESECISIEKALKKASDDCTWNCDGCHLQTLQGV